MRIEDVLDLVTKEKRISERAAAVAQKVGATVLIAAGVVVGVAGIVLVVKVKRKIWPNLPKAVSTLKKKAWPEKKKNYENQAIPITQIY